MVCAEIGDDDWGNVFKFQTKMAEFGSAKAQYILGEMYEEGRGVKQDYTKAFEWYNKAKENGHNSAAKRISQLKAKIATAKLNKKLAKRKRKLSIKSSVLPKKAKTIKSRLTIKADKKSSVTKTEPSQAAVISPTKKVQKQPSSKKTEIVVRTNKPTGSFYDINRLKGTILDDAEDAFE